MNKYTKEETRPIVCKFCGHLGEIKKVKVDGVTMYQGEHLNPNCLMHPFNTEPMTSHIAAQYKWESWMGKSEKIIRRVV